MSEKVKRKEPLKATWKELAMKSGNQCAFPGCTSIMVDTDGVLIGQMCHIEAASEEGQRFNPNQSNEDRRSFSNLMMMCYPHHQITNDVDRYPVETLKQMKANHELKYSGIEQTIRDSTEETEITPATKLNRLADILKWGLEQEELDASLPEFSKFCAAVKKLPISIRKLLVIIIIRSEHIEHLRDDYWGGAGISVSELGHVCKIDVESLKELLYILDTNGLIGEGDPHEFNGLPCLHLCKLPSGWDVCDDLKRFSESIQLPLSTLLVDLDFSSLDL